MPSAILYHIIDTDTSLVKLYSLRLSEIADWCFPSFANRFCSVQLFVVFSSVLLKKFLQNKFWFSSVTFSSSLSSFCVIAYNLACGCPFYLPASDGEPRHFCRFVGASSHGRPGIVFGYRQLFTLIVVVDYRMLYIIVHQVSSLLRLVLASLTCSQSKLMALFVALKRSISYVLISSSSKS